MPGFFVTGDFGLESNRVETARAHRWFIEKLGPIDGVQGIDGNAAWYAKSFGFPDQSSKIETAKGAGIDYKFAGEIEYSSAVVTFYDILTKEGTTAKKILDDWSSQVRGSDFNTVGLAHNYKDSSIFYLTDGAGGPVFSITLVNSWPSKISHSELSYTESAICEVSVELTFDWYLSRSGLQPEAVFTS